MREGYINFPFQGIQNCQSVADMVLIGLQLVRLAEEFKCLPEAACI